MLDHSSNPLSLCANFILAKKNPKNSVDPLCAVSLHDNLVHNGS